MFSVQSETVLIQNVTNYFGFYLHFNPLFTVANEYFVYGFFLLLSPVVFPFDKKITKIVVKSLQSSAECAYQAFFFRPIFQNVKCRNEKRNKINAKYSIVCFYSVFRWVFLFVVEFSICLSMRLNSGRSKFKLCPLFTIRCNYLYTLHLVYWLSVYYFVLYKTYKYISAIQALFGSYLFPRINQRIPKKIIHESSMKIIFMHVSLNELQFSSTYVWKNIGLF